MKLIEIYLSNWINGKLPLSEREKILSSWINKITSEQTYTSFNQLSNSIRSQCCLKSPEWIRVIKYNGIKFIFTNLLDNNKNFTVMIHNTQVSARFILNRPAYGKRFWANFHKRLASICDQMIIYQIHNQ